MLNPSKGYQVVVYVMLDCVVYSDDHKIRLGRPIAVLMFDPGNSQIIRYYVSYAKNSIDAVASAFSNWGFPNGADFKKPRIEVRADVWVAHAQIGGSLERMIGLVVRSVHNGESSSRPIPVTEFKNMFSDLVKAANLEKLVPNQ